ncbi:MAG: ABC transporter ATP-binding protein/permease [Verrucomicrobiota bacterium]
MTTSTMTTWQRFLRLVKPVFLSEIRWIFTLLLVVIVAFALASRGMDFVISYINRDFFNALALREKAGFFHQLYYYLAALAVLTVINVFYRFTEERFALFWRGWLSRKYIDDYLHRRAYYKILAYPEVDNPDQRIQEDVRNFTTTTLSIFMILLNSTFTFLSFIYILYSISGRLVVAAVVYAVAGSVVAYLLGKPLIALNFSQLRKEADFRYKLINVRDNAEAIALIRGEAKETVRVRQRLRDCVQNLADIIGWTRNLNFFTFGYNFLIPIIPTVIAAPLYLDGKIEFGVVIQAAGAFSSVLTALSVVVSNFNAFSSLAAVTTRLGSFSEALDASTAPDLPGEEIVTVEKPLLQFSDVTLCTPGEQKVLIRNLTFKLERQSLLICGPSGSGKSSVLRVIAGLWQHGSGTLTRPPLHHAAFLPQRPYMALGSLRNQLLYSVHKSGIADSHLHNALVEVGLEKMFDRVGGMDAELDWGSYLSNGERQLLAFARVLLSKPEYVFLDEATSALDAETEEIIYERVKTFAKLFASVGNRRSIGKFHDAVLELKGDGSWRFEFC